MTNKIKSLIYLSCIILASVVYNLSTELTPNQEIATNVVKQEPDVVINPYLENNEQIKTN
ncbi:MAG: hypothetical protein WBB24_18515 [Maribacter sp.]